MLDRDAGGFLHQPGQFRAASFRSLEGEMDVAALFKEILGRCSPNQFAKHLEGLLMQRPHRARNADRVFDPPRPDQVPQPGRNDRQITGLELQRVSLAEKPVWNVFQQAWHRIGYDLPRRYHRRIAERGTAARLAPLNNGDVAASPLQPQGAAYAHDSGADDRDVISRLGQAVHCASFRNVRPAFRRNRAPWKGGWVLDAVTGSKNTGPRPR